MSQSATEIPRPGIMDPCPLEDFNPEQRAAIDTTARHTLVLAGAGTGETRTIIGRASHLLKTGVPAEELLFITFTRRAASEIRSRINASCQQNANIVAGTFHSWAMQLIRRNPGVFQLDSPTLLDRNDALTMFGKFRRSLEQAGVPQGSEDGPLSLANGEVMLMPPSWPRSKLK